MDVLLLPGNSKRGKDWLVEVEAQLVPQFDTTLRHDYAHWETGEPEIDLDLESQRLAAAMQDWQSYVVFAKSAGTILSSKVTAAGTLQPRACLFVGLPLVMIRDHNLPVKEWLEKTDFSIVILQHTSDPFGTYAEVAQFIQSLSRENITVYELPGDTHDYLEFAVFSEYMLKLELGK